MKPFFSIAVTTYDRVDLLREALTSLLNQTFSDFEILVGNDNPERKIENILTEFKDPRIKWINHKNNLGSIENTNYLIGLCSGKYITTLSDDDLMFPDFLEKVYEEIMENPTVKVFFSEYVDGLKSPQLETSKTIKAIKVSGADWLEGYLSKQYKIIGSYGVYEKNFLNSIGRVHSLGSVPAFSPYNDNLMVVQAGSAENIVLIQQPLVFFRLHPQSLSFSSTNADAFSSAQIDFLNFADKIFSSADKVKRRSAYYSYLLSWFIEDYFSVLIRDNKIGMKSIFEHYFYFIKKIIQSRSQFSKFMLLNKLLAHYLFFGQRK